MPGIIITIAQRKGGAAKTTLAAHLALAWAARHRVAVVDIDPQGNLAARFRQRQARLGADAAIEVAAITGLACRRRGRATGARERHRPGWPRADGRHLARYQ